MKPEFLIERQGKTFVLYAGLLEEAHDHGLLSIETNLLQIPTPENGGVAIVKARATMGDQRFFDGLGDASAENVSRMILPHIIRMAETRAKARALRDAVNVGVTALEELGGDDSADATRPTPIRAAEPNRRAPADVQHPPVEASAASTGVPATPNQVRAIYGIGRSHGRDEAAIDELATRLYGAVPDKLNKRQASDLIQAMQNGEVATT